MPRSIFIHIVTVNAETISSKEMGVYENIMLNPGNEGSKHHRQSTRGCVRLELSDIFSKLHSSLLFLSNIVYSKGEHMSYSASVGKV
jgi:hypothetical protein